MICPQIPRCSLTFPLRAVENGANFLAEGFLFTVAASIIIGEQWRSSRSQTKRRDTVDDQLQDLSVKVQELTDRAEGLKQKWGTEIEELKEKCVPLVSSPGSPSDDA
jgi:hypothetical protein